MITLIIEASGTRPPIPVRVDESAVVGTCVASLVKQLNYPRTDPEGQPVVYQLRVVGSNLPFPMTARFAHTRIHSGAHVILEANAAHDATLPNITAVTPQRVFTPGQPLQAQVAVHRRSRRSALFFISTMATFSVAGLGTGFATALAQRFLRRSQNAQSTLGTPRTTGGMTSHNALLQGAHKMLTFTGHQGTVGTVGWSPDGTMLASGGDDRQVIIWGPTGKVQQRILHPSAVLSLAWSPESQRVVTGAGSQVAFFTALTGTMLSRSEPRPGAKVSSLSWTPNNQMQVVSGSANTQAVVWETMDYQPQATFSLHTTSIESVSWGSDGQTVASSSAGGVVRVWNAETTQETHGFYQDARVPMRACAFAPVGTALAVGGDDGIVRVWNGFLCHQQQTATSGLLCQDVPLRFKTSDKAIRSLAWSSDGRYLASGSDDGSFTLWTPAQRQTPLFTITIAAGTAVHCLAWSPGGNQLATAVGNTVILWSLT